VWNELVTRKETLAEVGITEAEQAQKKGKNTMSSNEEKKLLEAARTKNVPWKWGPCLSEKALQQGKGAAFIREMTEQKVKK
jgi:hypothetical protein